MSRASENPLVFLNKAGYEPLILRRGVGWPAMITPSGSDNYDAQQIHHEDTSKMIWFGRGTFPCFKPWGFLTVHIVTHCLLWHVYIFRIWRNFEITAIFFGLQKHVNSPSIFRAAAASLSPSRLGGRRRSCGGWGWSGTRLKFLLKSIKSREPWKKWPGCLGFQGMKNYPVLWGFFINHYKDPH